MILHADNNLATRLIYLQDERLRVNLWNECSENLATRIDLFATRMFKGVFFSKGRIGICQSLPIECIFATLVNKFVSFCSVFVTLEN